MLDVSKLQLDKMSLEDFNEQDESTAEDDDLTIEEILSELTNCIYLQDTAINLYGLKFYGTPWQPEFGGWAFNLPRGQVS